MLHIDFINVGYGDAILIREEQSGFAMLVDCGDEPKQCKHGAADYLQDIGLKKLDLLVITHLHKDHCGGLGALVNAIEIGELWSNYLPAGEQNAIALCAHGGANNLAHALNEYHCALQTLRFKTRMRAVERDEQHALPGGITLQVECAHRDLYERQRAIIASAIIDGDAQALSELDTFINDMSIRLTLTVGTHVIALPGDVSAGYWLRTPPSACDILKVPHHAHADALSEALLARLSPKHAVISVSNDRPDDCPSAHVLSLLDAHKCNVAYTDGKRGEQGGTCISFAIGGQKL